MSGLWIGTMAIGGTAAYGANAGWFGDPGGTDISPTNIVEHPRDPWAVELNKKTSQNMAGMWDMLNSGQLPQWWQNQADTAQQGMVDNLKQQTFGGRPGLQGPSVMDTAYNAGAATGVGPKGTLNQVNKVQGGYLDKLNEIYTFMAGKGMDYGAQTQRDLIYGTPGQQQGPQVTVQGGQPYQRPPSSGAQLAGSLGNMAMSYGMSGVGGGGGGAQPFGVQGATGYNPAAMSTANTPQGYTVPKSGKGYTPIYSNR